MKIPTGLDRRLAALDTATLARLADCLTGDHHGTLKPLGLVVLGLTIKELVRRERRGGAS
jgi:hypothetical protein